MSSFWPFARQPRKVQIAALEKAMFNPGFAYFMRMRMGKTGTLLAEYENYRKTGDVDSLLVIVPNSLKAAWADAVREWGMNVDVLVYDADKKRHVKEWLRKHAGVIILNYDSASTFFTQLWDARVEFGKNGCMLALDESTAIKDPSSVRTKTILKYAPDFIYRRVLTGKPKANHNADLWAQLKLIGAHGGMSYYGFRNTFCQMGGWMGKVVVADMNNDYLHNIMDDKVFIAGDEYLTDIQHKVYMPLRQITMTEKQRQIYKRMERDLIADIEDKQVTAPIALTKYLRLRQITSGIYTDESGEQHNIMEPLDNPRIREVMDILAESEGKTLIVTTFKLSAANLMYALGKWKPAILEGGMSSEDIREQTRRFNEDPECRVMIGNLQVLQFGHTLPGSDDDPCDSIIYYENDFSLINRAQSEARPEKLGRNLPIAIFDFYASKMDKLTVAALLRKEDAALALLGYARKHGVFGDQSNAEA
jgi:hypothetical protein